MFRKVIVGFDGSEHARDALALGAVLTAIEGELIVCCVHHFKSLSARVDPTEPRLDRTAAERCAGEATGLVSSVEVNPILTTRRRAECRRGAYQRARECLRRQRSSRR
jgi:Universal stress protein family